MNANYLMELLANHGLQRAVGVPDSSLAVFVDALAKDSRFNVEISTNECEAISIAFGHYLGSAKPSLVYLQNSGFGKTIHPISSLLAADSCQVPALLLIGWRGDHDGERDEPQHRLMGKAMLQILETIQVPYALLDSATDELKLQITNAFEFMKKNSTPYALIARPNYFKELKKNVNELNPLSLTKKEIPFSDSLKSFVYVLSRHEVIQKIYSETPAGSFIVSTTGKISRELYTIHEKNKKDLSTFYTVGGMGCASSIALGLTQTTKDRKVIVIDGDGAALMQMGSFAKIASVKPDQMIHILIDNECHDSTGGQPTVSALVNLANVATSCGYPLVFTVKTETELSMTLTKALAQKTLSFILIKCRPGDTVSLGRPTSSPAENTQQILKNLKLI